MPQGVERDIAAAFRDVRTAEEAVRQRRTVVRLQVAWRQRHPRWAESLTGRQVDLFFSAALEYLDDVIRCKGVS